ncbi:MAG TPA: DUF4277 domain-containing protein [Candidatus Competibacteraceae bacterium]|nr:DUF4277 domain-containing protein [Candidatus Competibacteraceae bacterium]
MTSLSSPGAPDPGAYASHPLDQHGLVAGMVEEVGWVGKLDALIRQDLEQRRVSVGRAVKAMSLMGLGFTSRALSLTPPFFADKPVERWLGAGVAAGHVNDDALGRALDAIHAYGVEWLYARRAGGVVKPLGGSCAGGHRDATRFQVDGEYHHRDAGVAAGGGHLLQV